MKNSAFQFLFVLSIFFLFQNCQHNVSHKGEDYPFFSNDGSWCWFSDPRAVYYKGENERTYAGWVSNNGDICIGYLDHISHEIKQQIIHENFEKDDHDNPSIYITEEGYIWVFYSKHASPEPIYLQKSIYPENIEHWKPIDTLSLNDTVKYKGFRDSYTYVNICRLSTENNKMFIFWRGMDFKPNFSVSTDTGQSWSNGKILILPERIYRERRPYIKISSNNKDKIHFAFTDGHPRDEPANSIYYMYYKDNNFYKANAEKITTLDSA